MEEEGRDMKGGGHGVGGKGWWEEKDGTGVKVNEGNRVEVNKGRGEVRGGVR